MKRVYKTISKNCINTISDFNTIPPKINSINCIKKYSILAFIFLILLSSNAQGQNDSDYKEGVEFSVIFTETCDKMNIETQRFMLETAPNPEQRAKYSNLLDECEGIDDSRLNTLKKLLTVKELNNNWNIAKICEDKKKELRKKIKDEESFISNLESFNWFCRVTIPRDPQDPNLKKRLDNIMSQGIKNYQLLKKEHTSSPLPNSEETIELEQNNTNQENLYQENPETVDSTTSQTEESDTTNDMEPQQAQSDITTESQHQLENNETIAAGEQASSLETGFILLAIPTWQQIMDTPLLYTSKFLIFLILIFILTTATRRFLLFRKYISHKTLFNLENRLLREEKSAKKRNETVIYFSTQEWEKRIKEKCAFLGKHYLMFWKFNPENLKVKFENEIENEVNKYIKKENAGNQRGFKDFVQANKEEANQKGVIYLSEDEAKNKMRTIIDSFLQNEQTAKEAHKATINHKNEIESKINSITQNAFQDKESFESAKHDFTNYFNSLIQTVKERIYEDDYDDKIETEITNISNKFYQRYGKSLAKESIDKFIFEELDYFKKEFYQQPFHEMEAFNKSFISFETKTETKIKEFIINQNVFYLPFPGPGFFINSKKSRTFNNESAFKLTITTDNPNLGKFEFVEKPERKNNAVKSYRRFLQPVCAFDNSPINAKDFIVKSEGTAIKQGDKWMVSEENKMRIEFTY